MCAAVWHKLGISLHHKQKHSIMKNTEYSVDALSTVISSDAFSALKDMIDDLGLEVLEVSGC